MYFNQQGRLEWISKWRVWGLSGWPWFELGSIREQIVFTSSFPPKVTPKFSSYSPCFTLIHFKPSSDILAQACICQSQSIGWDCLSFIFPLMMSCFALYCMFHFFSFQAHFERTLSETVVFAENCVLFEFCVLQCSLLSFQERYVSCLLTLRVHYSLRSFILSFLQFSGSACSAWVHIYYLPLSQLSTFLLLVRHTMRRAATHLAFFFTRCLPLKLIICQHVVHNASLLEQPTSVCYVLFCCFNIMKRSERLRRLMSERLLEDCDSALGQRKPSIQWALWSSQPWN